MNWLHYFEENKANRACDFPRATPFVVRTGKVQLNSFAPARNAGIPPTFGLAKGRTTRIETTSAPLFRASCRMPASRAAGAAFSTPF